jgi:hypothetical protein
MRVVQKFTLMPKLSSRIDKSELIEDRQQLALGKSYYSSPSYHYLPLRKL